MANRDNLKCLSLFFDAVERCESTPIRFSKLSHDSGLSYTTIQSICEKVDVISKFLNKCDLRVDFENRLIHIVDDKKDVDFEVINLSLIKLGERLDKITLTLKEILKPKLRN